MSTSETTELGDNVDALPGYLRLAAPVPSPALVTVAAEGSYGNYSAVGSLPGPSIQWTGRLAVAVSPVKYFAARLGLRGDYNKHADDQAEKNTYLYGEPELALRFQVPRGNMYFGGEIEARFVGAQAPDVYFAATTPTLRGMFAYNLKKRTWLGAQAGFRFDNTSKAITDIEAVHDGDRLTLAASSFNAVELGLAGSHRFGKMEVIGEVSADILVGKGSPSFGDGPISLGVAGRYHLIPELDLRGYVDISPSGHPEPYPQDVLIETRPRVQIGLGLSYRFGLPEQVAPAAFKPELVKTVVAPPPPAEVAPDAGRLVGRVLDEAGRPIPDVEMLLKSGAPEAPPQKTFTDVEGRFVFEEIPPGAVEVATSTPGYDPSTQKAEIKKDEEAALEYTLYESLPAGQVRGRVLDFAGKPLLAEVTVSPGDAVVPVAEDGSFSIDLKPGRYKVRFAFEGYAAQVRVVRVQDKGVVVLNIALEK